MRETSNRDWLGFGLGVLLMVGAISPSHAVDELKMVITKGRTDAQEISVVPFGWMGASGAAPIDIAGIIASDLERSGRFAPTPVADLPGRPVEKEQINFSDWRLLGPLNLVIGQLQPLPGGRYAVRFRLFDVFKGTQVSGFEFEALPAELRRTAHEISDIIYEALTGEPGAFNTRIAYVTEVSLGAGEKRYTLHVADSDGENAHVILESTQPLLSPAWSPDGRRLAYVSFEGRRPRVYVQDLASGQRESVSSYRGLNSAPAWSPDGRRLALTLSKDGNAEIYVLDLSSRRLQRITHNGAIDTEPAWSPDGQSIVFTSDRGGKPQIYQIPAGGGRATRLTFEGSYNARATYAPDGGRLAFVHGREGVYRIALLDLGNGALLTLTDSTLDESPSFAPNGSMLLYATTDTAGAALAAVSVDGEVHQRLAVQKGNVREPAWSPFRKPR